VAIARQCGIITNEKVDEFNDLLLNPNLPIKSYDPEDVHRICKSIVLSGKELSATKDEQWSQVNNGKALLIAALRIRRNCICKNNARAKT
jgi:magnesium-transporting ATPase (P-type)